MASMPHAATMSKAWAPMQSQRQFLQPAQATKRDLLNGVALGGFAAVVGKKDAFAVTPVDIKDDRAAVGKGIDIIYEARDLDLPQNVRDGFTQARESDEFTKKRISESVGRMNTEVLANIKTAYWTQAKEGLRRQIGSLRFDLNTLASAKEGEQKKLALKARQTALTDIEQLDFAIKAKDQELALKRFPVAMASLEAALKVL